MELRQKANINRVEQIEIMLHDYATKIEFNQIKSQLEAYTTLDVFHKNRMAVEYEFEKITETMKTLVT